MNKGLRENVTLVTLVRGVMDEGYLVAINKRIAYHQRELRDCLEKRDAIIRYYNGDNSVANN